jgi:hypothetical protein
MLILIKTTSYKNLTFGCPELFWNYFKRDSDGNQIHFIREE